MWLGPLIMIGLTLLLILLVFSPMTGRSHSGRPKLEDDPRAVLDDASCAVK